LLTPRVVGPGADILLNALEPYDPNLTPAMLTTDQWSQLANAFHTWVFKPDVLEDETYVVEQGTVDEFRSTNIIPSQELSDEARELLEREEELVDIQNEYAFEQDITIDKRE
jgi:hypothetical protein